MPGVARFKDLFSGICCCHSDPTCISMGGYVIGNTPLHISQGLNVARVTDLVIGYCGHPGKIITASGKVSSAGLGTAYIGSQVNGCLIGTIVTGSSKHTAGI